MANIPINISNFWEFFELGFAKARKQRAGMHRDPCAKLRPKYYLNNRSV